MATIKGVYRGGVYWQNDFQATQDDKGFWSASISFVCYMDEVTTRIPNRGSACQEPGWTFLGLQNCKVDNYQGGLAQVLCNFGGTLQQDFTFDENSSSTELAISTGEEPILTHPRYKDLSDDDRINIQHLLAGRLKPKEGGGYILKTDEKNVKTIDFEDEMASELVGKINAGITTYLSANQVFRISYSAKRRLQSSVLNDVGKIDSPQGAPSFGEDRNWLFMGATEVKSGSGYSVTLEWRLSGLGGWDESLYE